MRWPFGPPHLTLKPSKKSKETKKKTRKANKKKKGKKNTKNDKNAKKRAFQLSVKFFFFLVGVQNFPFLTTWPKKRAPKNTIKIGVSATHFLENSSESRNGSAILDQKTQIQKFQLSFFFAFFFSYNNKKHKS